MIEDQLTKDERIRLEALNQANATNQMARATTEKILSDARKYESYIKGEA